MIARNKIWRKDNLFRSSLILITVLTLLFTSNATAQKVSLDGKQIQVPSEEEFQPANGLITETIRNAKRNVNDNSESDTIKLHNADGSIWYEFSKYNKNSQLYYKINPNSEYKPFTLGYTAGLALRLKAVSKNWYEVVVNEETGLTKFTWLDDPVLRRDKWEIYFTVLGFITFDKDKNPLRESPNGQIKSRQINDNDRFQFQAVKDDWMMIKDFNGTELSWIRWRKDSDVLIGFLANKWIVPKTK